MTLITQTFGSGRGDAQAAEAQLVADLVAFRHDPLGFVLYAFEWGEGELADHPGPDQWQRDVLADIGMRLALGEMTVQEAILYAIASGHGIGKSALVAWLILWAMATHEDTRGVVTANTETQLKTKTWAELAKWYRRCICRHWFVYTATALFSADPEHEKTWRIDMVAWSERNTEAFAGLHNQGKRIIVIFDEASAIPDVIWETTEGALTDADTEILWFAFGNPTRNTGRFRDAFGKLRRWWQTRQVDSRTARMTNKAQIAKWVEAYGEDSDFVRVRVKGQFPRAATTQFIASDVVEHCRTAEPLSLLSDPVIVGVDVARFGDDESVIFTRRGRDARTIPVKRYSGIDTMKLAALVAEHARQVQADAVFVDGGGVGGGVVDRLRQLHVDVIEVQFGSSADDPKEYANKRTEMWARMRAGLKEGLAIPDDQDLAEELTGIEYGFVGDETTLKLERKKDMKSRMGRSPDRADGLALTYAYTVAPRRADGRPFNAPAQVLHDYNPHAAQADHDYDPYGG